MIEKSYEQKQGDGCFMMVLRSIASG